MIYYSTVIVNKMRFELNTCLKIPLRRRYMPVCETNHPQDVRIWCYICVSDLLSFLTCYSVDDMLAMRTFLSVQLCHCHPSHTPVSLQAWWWILNGWRDLCYCSFCRPLLPLTLEIISIALKKQCNQAIKFNTWKHLSVAGTWLNFPLFLMKCDLIAWNQGI